MPPSDREQLHKLFQMAHKYNIQALMTACRLTIMSDLQSHELVEIAIVGYLCKDDELKKSTLSMMGREVGPLSELKNWALLEKYPALSLEIADQKSQSHSHSALKYM